MDFAGSPSCSCGPGTISPFLKGHGKSSGRLLVSPGLDGRRPVLRALGFSDRRNSPEHLRFSQVFPDILCTPVLPHHPALLRLNCHLSVIGCIGGAIPFRENRIRSACRSPDLVSLSFSAEFPRHSYQHGFFLLAVGHMVIGRRGAVLSGCSAVGAFLVKACADIFLVLVIGAAPLLRWLFRGHFNSGPWLAYRLRPCGPILSPLACLLR